MTVFAVLALAALGTYLLRASMVLGADRLPALDRWLAPRLPLVAPSVLAAIVCSSLLAESGGDGGSAAVGLVAVAVGFATVLRTGNAANALLVGLPVIWLITLAGSL
jgi:branched-subunit amino acid transport protein